MRFLGFAVMTGAALMISACGGDKAPAADTTNAMAGNSMTPAMGDSAMAGNAMMGSGAMAPVTGTMHEVKMIGDAAGFRFEPADFTVKPGDGVKFTFESGGPHNVAFDPSMIPAGAKDQLSANMPEQMGELSGRMLLAPGETYTVSFAGLPAGQYHYNCTPHLAMGMKGVITVQ